MKKDIKKITTFLLSFLTVCGCSFGCQTQDVSVEERTVSLPDYSSTNLEFIFEAGVTNGYIGNEYVEELDYFNEEDLHTLRFCADMGNNSIKLDRRWQRFELDETWEESKTKKAGDKAYAAGFKRILIGDHAFGQYMEKSYMKVLDPEVGVYKSEEELDAFVTERLKLYINEPWFDGINLRDEPGYKETDNIGAIAASIYRCAERLGKPDIRVHVNLHPCIASPSAMEFVPAEQIASAGTEPTEGQYTTAREIYRAYIENYVVSMNAKMMMVDLYPYSVGRSTTGFYGTLQTLREVCTKYDIDMGFYAQSNADYHKGKPRYRVMGQSEMYHNLNSLIGFGTSQISWYRYMPFNSYTTANDGNYQHDDGYLCDRYGNPNDLYYYAKDIVSEFQSFANIILNYDFQGAKFFRKEGVSMFDVDDMLTNVLDKKTQTRNGFDNSYELQLVKDVEMSNDIMLLTELYDEKNDQFMYMVMNSIDPFYSSVGDTTQEVTVDFGTDYEWAAEFDCGQLSYVKLDNGKYTKTLSAGYATYVMPLKKAQ